MVTAPALYACELRHLRTLPLRYGFVHRTYLWLVDLDDLPRLPVYLRPLARFDARDHLGDPSRTIRANVERFLAAHGTDLCGGRVLMLCHARVLGHVFNPLTLFWCRRADGTLAGVVAEVHNTYGGRHCYLLLPDRRHSAETAKAIYVSPFFPVDGRYRMRLPEPSECLAITVRLERDGQTPFVAVLRGVRRAPTTANILRLAIRHPWVTVAVRLRIHLHGIGLFLRGLPVQPRPGGTGPASDPSEVP